MLGQPWDDRFMGLAEHISSWSKDPSTKVGAIAVSNEKQILSMGWNGFPRGILDHDYRLENRDVKYEYVCHAEMNCIYNATHNGISLNNSCIYIHGMYLCNECAKGIIQVGARAIMIHDTIIAKKRIEWSIAWNVKTIPLLREAGVLAYMKREDGTIIRAW